MKSRSKKTSGSGSGRKKVGRVSPGRKTIGKRRNSTESSTSARAPRSKDRDKVAKKRPSKDGKSFGKKPVFDRNQRSERGGDSARNPFSKPYTKRSERSSDASSSERPVTRSRDAGDERPRSGVRKPFTRERSTSKVFDKPNEDRPKRPYSSDRSDDRPKRPYSTDRKPSSDRSDDRPKRPYSSDRSDDRPKRPYSTDRKPVSDRSDDRPKRPYSSDRSDDRPKRPYSTDRKPASDRSDDRPKRPYSSDRSDDRPKRAYTKRGDSPASESRDTENATERSSEKPGWFSDRDRASSDRASSEKKKSFSKSSKDRPSTGGEKKWNRKEDHAFYGDKKKKAGKSFSDSSAEDDGSTRLNKFIANAGICSRREADELIIAGVISVNGKVVTELGFKINQEDEVKYNNSLLRGERLQYILLNKPKDFITTTDDPDDRKTVMSLVGKACKERIYPVGRLDRNTTGVLLFTNDGDLAKKLTHPSFEVQKIYQVELDNNLKQTDYEAIEEGLKLEDGPIKVDDIVFGTEKNILGVELHSGKNRIVRRIFEHLGYEVKKLDRVVFAGLTKKDLPRGRWRFLSDLEIANLKMAVGKKKVVR